MATRRTSRKPRRTSRKPAPKKTSVKPASKRKRTPRRKTTAWKEGVRIALANGQRLAPYPTGTDKRTEWVDGYDAARKELQAVRRKLLGR